MATSVQALAVTAVDRDGGQIAVVLPSGDQVYVPAPSGLYTADAWVVMDGAQPLYATGPKTSRGSFYKGTLVSVTTGNATITMDDTGASIVVPVLAGNYAAGDRMWIDFDEWGRPTCAAEWQVSAGSTDGSAPSAPTGSVDVPPTTGPTYVSARAQIGPVGIGTFRTSSGKWQDWNAGRFGWPSLAYQGSKYGSGSLLGLAGFGSQIVGLGAVSIERATLTVQRTDGDGGAAQPIVQGSGWGAPEGGSPNGLTSVSGGSSVGAGGWSDILINSDAYSGMALGSIPGFVFVGSTYSSWTSCILTIDYTRLA